MAVRSSKEIVINCSKRLCSDVFRCCFNLEAGSAVNDNPPPINCKFILEYSGEAAFPCNTNDIEEKVNKYFESHLNQSSYTDQRYNTEPAS